MKPRPLGVNVLALLYVLGGIWTLTAHGVRLGRLGGLAVETGLPFGLLYSSVSQPWEILYSLWSLGAGIGLWSGRPWGWWCASCYQIWHVLRGSRVVLLRSFADVLIPASFWTSLYDWSLLVSVLLSALMALYLFKRTVMASFTVRLSSRRSAFIAMVVVATGIVGGELVVSRHWLVWMKLNAQLLALLDREAYAEAAAMAEEGLRFAEAKFGPEHLNTAASLTFLGIIEQRRGKYDEPEPLYQRSVAIVERRLGTRHPAFAASLHHLARFYFYQGKYEDAIPLYEHVVTLLETRLGSGHPAVAAVLDEFGTLYQTERNYTAAEPLHRRALGILEAVHGPNHLRVATTLNNLAELYKEQGNYPAAEPLYQRVLAIRRRTLGPNDPQITTVLQSYAAMLRKAGRMQEADRLLLNASKP